MKVTTVFKNGPSTQAVRIPKEYRLDTDLVWIEQVPGGLLIRTKPDSWDDFFDKTQCVSDDFDMNRTQTKPQNRDET